MHIRVIGALANTVNGTGIGGQIVTGIFIGAGTFAEHIKGKSSFSIVLFGAAFKTFFNVAAQHILTAHYFHCLHHCGANNRFPRTGGESPDPVVSVFSDLCIETHQLAGQHQAPGGGIHKQGLGIIAMAIPVARLNLLGD